MVITDEGSIVTLLTSSINKNKSHRTGPTGLGILIWSVPQTVALAAVIAGDITTLGVVHLAPTLPAHSSVHEVTVLKQGNCRYGVLLYLKKVF